MYDPQIGRFLQRDQWPTPLTDPSSLVNRYLYCGNNPINFIDPMGLLTIGSEEGKFLLRLFEEAGGEPFRLQWRYGERVYHLAYSIKYGLHYANEAIHYYLDRRVILEHGKWIEIAHPFLVKATLIAASGYIGWKIGSWIADLPVPNLIGAYEWDVKFGNAFVPSSWNLQSKNKK